MTPAAPRSLFRRSLPTLRATTAFASLTIAALTAQGTVVQDWSRTVTLFGSNIYGTKIAKDANDAIYVTGYYPYYRIVTAKFAPDGTPLWQVDFANPGTKEHAAWVTVDPFGDVLVTGYSVAGASSLTPNGHVLLKYDPAGNLLWSRVDPGYQWSLSRVVTDGNGDVVVIGQAPAGIVKKYSRTGALLWTQPVAVNSLYGLALDPNGTIFVAGNLATSLVTAAFDPAGNPLWTHTTPAATGVTDLALGPAGEVYVAGAVVGIAQNRSLVAKFDATGTPVWVHTYPGTQVRRLAVDSHGDVVCINGFNVSGGYFDWITHKISPAGAVLWSTIYDHHQYNDELPYALAIGADDEIYVTGQGGPGPTSGTLSYHRTVTVRYSRFGTQEWAGSSFTSLRSLGLVQLSDNSIATVGESTFTVFHYRQSGVWRSVLGAMDGSLGSPRLEGTGSPVGTAPVSLELSGALPGAPAWLVGGLSRVDLPLLGGVLVPSLDVLVGILPDASGSLSVPFAWPGLPPGFDLHFQAWILDPAGPAGFAASNGIVGISG